MRGWARRVAILTLVWAVLYAVLVLAGFGVDGVLLAVLFAGAAAVICVVLDLGDVVGPARFEVGYLGRTPTGGADRRTARLRRWLEASTSGPTLTPVVHQALVDVVDDVLRHDHGVDLHTDPDAARRVLGPELSTFVYDHESADRNTHPRRLAAIVTRIESLSAGAANPGSAVPNRRESPT